MIWLKGIRVRRNCLLIFVGFVLLVGRVKGSGFLNVLNAETISGKGICTGLGMPFLELKGTLKLRRIWMVKGGEKSYE